MSKVSYLVDLGGLTFDEKDNTYSSWVHALPAGEYKHPEYGDININDGRVKSFVDGVKAKIRGIDPSINYVHNNNDVAAGWVKDAEARQDGVWLFVEWVKDAYEAIKAKKWRYFSSEYEDEWTDSKGKKHTDVIFGGALTNRPFMKNLVPINLSETSIEMAFELVSEITGTNIDSLKGGNGMPLSEDDVKKIVDGLAAQLKPADPPKPTEPAPLKLTDIPELKTLAEDNPIVKTLLEQFERQNAALSSSATKLKEADVSRRLAEFDNSKIVLTPVAKELASNLALEMPDELTENFWKLLSEMKRGSSFLVEVGERTGATINFGTQKSAEKEFQTLATALKTEFKLSEADALMMAAEQNPGLYKRYRSELNGVNA